ncbi:hypothetical protein FBD94_16860 [Pedobacter hiemivivus]|uniref:Uncharacterized protein n=1 Tax=Pedobacter hiemivivus TaxID=2530454 RepID=A0A4U1GDC7_9SPHI|nr:hypothetical protein [Pedobacter hiemivivus]TKC59202.1 hypothetical protein FBD94_16860 [Pedobacter hiemivivus]
MNYCLRILLLILFWAQIAQAQRSELTLKWGLQGSKLLFEEKTATKGQNSAIHPPRKKNEKLYRFIAPSGDYNDIFQPIAERHHILWEKFMTTKPDESKIQKLYSDYTKKHDPYLSSSTTSLAPRLYFDFIGKSNKVYILQSITVETINFEEYSGGGFINNLAWYDIVLNHKIGTKIYPVDKQLTFNTNGRAELRFFSDNYYPSFGMAPMGCYTIRIRFNFESDKKLVSASTEIFKIDV